MEKASDPSEKNGFLHKTGNLARGELCPYVVPVLRSLGHTDGAFKGINHVLRICPDRDRDTQRETGTGRKGRGKGSKYELRFPEKGHTHIQLCLTDEDVHLCAELECGSSTAKPS